LILLFQTLACCLFHVLVFCPSFTAFFIFCFHSDNHFTDSWVHFYSISFHVSSFSDCISDFVLISDSTYRDISSWSPHTNCSVNAVCFNCDDCFVRIIAKSLESTFFEAACHKYHSKYVQFNLSESMDDNNPARQMIGYCQTSFSSEC
jgi:hypothetical protein